MTRFDKANPQTEERRVAPKRDVTQNGSKPGTQGAVPYATKEEWRADRKAAGDNVAKLRAIDARYRASKF